MDHQFDNPYVGPRTFTQQQSHLFFGREREAGDLLSLVISERLTLFYAQSGAGKSSLIHTRLIPGLQAANFAVLPVGRVSGEVPAGITTVDNIFVFNLMLSLDQSQAAAQRFSQLSLTEFLAGLSSEDGQHYRYEPPVALNMNDDYPAVPYILIIDQFEEIITNHANRWPERADFFQQLNQAMMTDPMLWVVFSLREDFVAALDPYAHLLTDKMRARFYMPRMDAVAALEAIQQPAKLGGRPFAEGVAEMLVDNLRQIRLSGQTTPHLGQYVEPVQLQVVCYQLWENLKQHQTS